MEKTDLLKREDQVTVTILGPQGESLYQTTGTGYHTIDEAVREVLAQANLEVNPEDCVFEINNQTSGVSHSYRLNAHGHLKLIV